MSIRCGNRAHTDPKTQYADLLKVEHCHHSVAQVKLCFANPEGLSSIQEDQYADDLQDESRIELAEYQRSQGYGF